MPSQSRCAYSCGFSVLKSVYEQLRLSPSHHQLIAGSVALLLAYQLGGDIVFKNNKIVLFFPSVMYDFIQHLFFPMNYAIGCMCSILPTRNSVWSEPGYMGNPLRGSGKTPTEVRASILSGNDVVYNESDLVSLYDSCPAVCADDMVGKTWNGQVLRTNRSVLDIAEWLLVRPLGLLGFKWGKRYITQHIGDPLLVRWLGVFYFPLPVWGNVGMVDIRWRGTSTATMNYDYQPWKDYFRLLSKENGQSVVLGVWTHKDKAGGWFMLQQDSTVPTVY